MSQPRVTLKFNRETGECFVFNLEDEKVTELNAVEVVFEYNDGNVQITLEDIDRVVNICQGDRSEY